MNKFDIYKLIDAGKFKDAYKAISELQYGIICGNPTISEDALDKLWDALFDAQSNK